MTDENKQIISKYGFDVNKLDEEDQLLLQDMKNRFHNDQVKFIDDQEDLIKATLMNYKQYDSVMRAYLYRQLVKRLTDRLIDKYKTYGDNVERREQTIESNLRYYFTEKRTGPLFRD